MSEFISKLTAFDLLLFFTFNTHTRLKKTLAGHHFFHIYKSDINLQKSGVFLQASSSFKVSKDEQVKVDVGKNSEMYVMREAGKKVTVMYDFNKVLVLGNNTS